MTRMIYVFIVCGFLSMLMGAILMARTVLPEWQRMDVPESIAYVGVKNGMYFALSETDHVYSCSNIVEYDDCRGADHVVDLVLLKMLVNKRVVDGPTCQSMRESLGRFLAADVRVVSCVFGSGNKDAPPDLAFLADGDGAVWRWIKRRVGVFSLAVYGAVFGLLATIVLFVPVALVALVWQKLARRGMQN